MCSSSRVASSFDSGIATASQFVYIFVIKRSDNFKISFHVVWENTEKCCKSNRRSSSFTWTMQPLLTEFRSFLLSTLPKVHQEPKSPEVQNVIRFSAHATVESCTFVEKRHLPASHSVMVLIRLRMTWQFSYISYPSNNRRHLATCQLQNSEFARKAYCHISFALFAGFVGTTQGITNMYLQTHSKQSPDADTKNPKTIKKISRMLFVELCIFSFCNDLLPKLTWY